MPAPLTLVVPYSKQTICELKLMLSDDESSSARSASRSVVSKRVFKKGTEIP